MKAAKRFSVMFNKPEFNAIYEFDRCKSGAFTYGNGSAVIVTRNGKFLYCIDTRYDNSVMGDFATWCKEWLLDNLNPDFEPMITEV